MDAKTLGEQPAYPTNEMHGSAGEYVMQAYGGLTKREEFAKAAMQGLCANACVDGSDSELSWVPIFARRMAEATLAELARE